MPGQLWQDRKIELRFVAFEPVTPGALDVRAAREPDGERDGGTELDRGVITEQEQETRPPKMYKVLLHNDDYTTMEFVVEILETVFHHSHAAATQIMLHIHRKGIGVAGVYTYEVAETKVAIVEALARQREFPLKCTMEEA